MKKFTLSVFFAAVMINGATAGYTQIANVSATAADEQINISNASGDNVMQLLDAYFEGGVPFDIQLVIYNNQEFVAFQLDVPLPEDFAYVAGSAALNSERIVDHFIQANVLPGTNVLRMISLSLTNAAYLGNEGVIVTFSLINTDWLPGYWLLPIENGIMATIEGVNILDYTIPGTLSGIGPVEFTVTFDVIDAFTADPISDATITLSGITNDPGNYVFENIELGSHNYSITAEGYEPVSGSIYVFDNLTVTVPLQSAFNNIMQIVDIVGIYAGEDVTIDLVIYNDQDFVAFQLDVPLPAGFGYMAGSVVLNPVRKQDHLIQASVLPGTNILRMISFSLTNSNYLGNEGVIASFTLTTPNIAGEYLLEIEGGIMADIQGTNILTGTIPGTITLLAEPPLEYTVTFSVQDENNVPIPNATITLGDQTNEPGDYVFENIAPGVYTYSVEAPGYLPETGVVEVVDENVTVIINMQLLSHSILATSGENGSIEPSGLIIVQHGSNQLFVITPDEGFHIDDVLVNGVSVGPVAQYEFVNVTSDHTIHASFAINVYTINATAGENGTIQPSGLVSVTHGGNQLFVITPDEGYHTEDVLVDGVSVGTVAQYEFVNVTGDHTIHASFAINVYTINAEPNNAAWGSVEGAGEYEHGATVTLTAIPAVNYKFIEWQEDGVVVSTDSIFVFTALADRNLVAIFDFVDGIPGTGGSDLSITMYPNPSSDIVNVSLNNENHRIEAIKVFDMRGKEVLNMACPFRTDVYTFTVGRLLPGTYLVRIISSDGIANRRLIVM